MSYIKNSPEYEKYFEAQRREDTLSFDTYQDYRYWLRKEAEKRNESLPSDTEKPTTKQS